MGSVGSGVAGEQEFAMKSVGTRTTLPRGPPLSRHIPPSNRLHIPPSASEESSEERGGTSNTTDRGQLNMARASANANGAGGASLDVCGNVVGHGAETKNHDGGMKGRDGNNSRQQRDSRTPPKILSVSGKVEQNTSALVRPSAFKPVVPKSFHSMQNLLAQSGGGGQSGGSGGGSDAPQSLCEQDSLDRDPTTDALSDSARNSLSSLPTYTGPGLGGYGSGPGLVVYGTSAPPSSGMGPLSASTSHINRLTTTTVPPAMDEGNNKPKYQNGYSVSQSQNASVSESGQSSSGKSCVSYQRLCQRPEPNTGEQDSPSTEDIIQDLEDRLWEKEQEVLHMRRSLDRSEAAIVQVFEEKQRVWEREMADLRQNYSSRLQQLSQRSQRSQHSLQIHMSRLQQDKRRLQEEISALLELRQELERKCLEYRKEQADMLPRLEESKWELCQKVGEISLLKQQLRESQAEVTQRAGETVALRGQIKELNAQLKEREEAMMGLKESYNSKSRELERCEGELKRTLAEVSVLRDKLVVFEAEVLGLKRALSDLSCRNDQTANLPARNNHPVIMSSRNDHTVPLSSRSDHTVTLSSRNDHQGPLTSKNEHSVTLSSRHEHTANIRNDHMAPLSSRNDHAAILSSRNDHPAPLSSRNENPGPLSSRNDRTGILSSRNDHTQALTSRNDHSTNLSSIGGSSSLPWAGLHSPRTPELGGTVDSFLSLQSDEAKAQRQEAGELRRQLERLQGELHLERQQRERQALTFAQERHTWQDEKDRVLKYQAQLQISYVETLQRNQALEERVGQLGAKLASTSPGSPPTSISIPVPNIEDLKTPVLSPLDPKTPILNQLAPPWPGPTRLERIESTEI